MLETGGQDEHAGEIMVQLKPWKERRTEGVTLEDVQGEIQALAGRFPDAELAAMAPPPIEDLAENGGVTFALQALDGQSFAELDEAALRLARLIRDSGLATYASSSFDARTPMLDFRLDRDKAEAMGVRVADVFAELETQLGSDYVNDFNVGDKTCQVVVQAARDFRGTVRDLERMSVVSGDGAQIPLSALGTFGWTLGSHRVERFNLFTAAAISCDAAPGVSTAELMDKIEELKAAELGRGYGIAWTGLSFHERRGKRQGEDSKSAGGRGTGWADGGEDGAEAGEEVVGDQAGHGAVVAVAVVGGEGVVIAAAVGEFDVDGRIAVLHQDEVEQEAARAAVAVDEGVDGLEEDVEQGRALDGVAAALAQPGHEGAHFAGNGNGVGRRVNGAEDADGDFAVGAALQGTVREDERMEFANEPFAEVRAFGDAVAEIAEGVAVADGFQVVLQRLLVDGDALEDQRRFRKGEGVAFDGVRVVGVFDREFVAEAGLFGGGEGAEACQFVAQGVDFAEKGDAIRGDVEPAGGPAVRRARRVGGNAPAAAGLFHPAEQAVFAKRPDAPRGNAPCAGRFRDSHPLCRFVVHGWKMA